jgi:hypothetical protein
MGQTTRTKCLDCGKTFSRDDGGGFFFHLLRCDHCGKTKKVAFDDIEELHLRYLKGMTKAYCVASMEHDEDVRKNTPVEPISEDEYHKGIEALVGKCRCRGNYTFDAPPRCPKCRSTRIEDYGPALCYD